MLLFTLSVGPKQSGAVSSIVTEIDLFPMLRNAQNLLLFYSVYHHQLFQIVLKRIEDELKKDAGTSNSAGGQDYSPMGIWTLALVRFGWRFRLCVLSMRRGGFRETPVGSTWI